MNLTTLKRAVSTSLPSPLVGLLKRLWQGGRRWINRLYFRLRHPAVVVLDVRQAVAGQLNQPLVIDHLLGGATGGFFLDIGANHPEFNSNTHFFETRRGFSGIALDPLESYRDAWRQLRPRTRLLNLAAGAAPGRVHFFQHANTDGWADQLSFVAAAVPDGAVGVTAREVEMVAVADLPGIPPDVAFVSIDVEGAEGEVLKGFRDTLRPRVLVVENCFGPVGNRALREQVRHMGYIQVGRISYIDDVYLRSDLAAATPALAALRRQRPDLFR